ncbi:MAG: PPOX class F420-dependent oxidoreductase [Dehalococcoidia bacterium]|nr:PPOX class F420-dependent oxidoreductase [Dehalococcoidia bacterium]
MPPTAEQETIIRAEKLAIMATLRRDGGPQLTPINYAYKDGRILISTTRDRAKYHNVRRNGQVALCIVRPEGRPYVTVLGRAQVEEEDIEDGTAEIFRRISDRPLPDNFGDVLRQQGRILIVVTPERFVP